MESTDEYKCLIDALNEVEPAVERAEKAVSDAESAVGNANAAVEAANAAASNANTAADAANQAANSIQSEISRLDKVNRSQDLEIEKLRAAAEGNLFMFHTDSDEAYEKAVPADVMPYATVDKIGGKTLVWNQLAVNEFNCNYIFSVQGEQNTDINYYTELTQSLSPIKAIAGHIYAVYIDASNLSDNIESINVWYGSPDNLTIATSNDGKASGVQFYTAAGTDHTLLRIVGKPQEIGTPPTFTGTINSIQIFDLTLIFGKGNEPATPEEFRAMFPAEYYPYSEPILMNFSSSAVVSRGRNIWGGDAIRESLTALGIDASSNDICVPGTAINGKVLYQHNFKPNTAYTLILKARKSEPFGGSRRGSNLYFLYADGTSQQTIFDATGGFHVMATTSDAAKTLIGIAGVHRIGPTFFVDPDGTGLFEGTVDESYFTPYRSVPYDTSTIVQKYFPDGMKSAGTVHDEIDFERMVAIQRVGSVDLGTLAWDYYETASMFGGLRIVDAPKHDNILNIISNKYLTTSGVQLESDKTISLNNSSYGDNSGIVWIRDSTYTTVEDFRSGILGEILYYELEVPIETPITDFFEETVEVESGGALMLKNNKGDDFCVPVPNQETFMIKLPNGGTT